MDAMNDEQRRLTRLGGIADRFLALCEEACERCPELKTEWDFLMLRTRRLANHEGITLGVQAKVGSPVELRAFLSELKLAGWTLYHSARDWRMAEEIASTVEKTAMRVSSCDLVNRCRPAPTP